jgi:hypothetical protein
MMFRRIWVATLIVLALSLLTGLTVARASGQPDEQCPPGEAFDPYTSECNPVVLADCGQNPYHYNTIGNHWGRRFERTCFPETRDPFEGVFHGLNFAEAQAKLAELGLGGLTHPQQVNALIERGIWDPIGEHVITEATKAGTGKLLIPTDCGPVPYRYNAIGGHFERRFSAFCYPITNDINDLLYSGLWINETPVSGQ